MSRLGWTCLIVLGLAACDGSPCEPQQLVDCASCGPGALRHAVALGRSPAALTNRGSAAAICATCDEVLALDANSVTTTLALGDGAKILSAAGAPDGSLYVIAEGPSSNPAVGTFVALAPDNTIRWSMPIATPFATDPTRLPLTEVVAGPQGPFVLTGENEVYASATAFTVDGAMRWTTSVGGAFVVADSTGGLYTALGDFEGAQAVVQIARLDAASGAPVATHTIRAVSSSGSPDVQVGFNAIALAPDGGLVVCGTTTGGLDFGDLRITTGAARGFVAAFDPSGAAKWAHAVVLESYFDAIGATADGIVAATHYQGATLGLPRPDSSDFDLAVMTFDATGMRSAFQIGGAGGQGTRRGPLVASDGAVWLSIFSEPDGGDGSARLVVGSDVLETGNDYLIELAI